jgi:cytochrome P450
LVEITKRHEDFLSGPGILVETLPAEVVEQAQSIIAMDPPRHDILRRLVSSAFTPKRMKRIEDRIRANGQRIVGDIASRGEADFVTDVAALMPMHNISDMLAVPEKDRLKLAHEASYGSGWNDPELMGDDEVVPRLLQAVTYAHNLVRDLATERRENPGDDLVSALATAEIEGQRLTDDEIGAFFILLTIAGNDTTRQSASHAMKALTDNPDQRAWLMEDFENRIGGAVEEFVRWASPIMTFRRTAAQDLDYHGQHISAGDKIVLIYSSANRDETVFEEPHRFDLSRDPNPHVGFGGGGIHHCLGNQLARIQLRVLFDELLHRLPDLEVGEPTLLTGNFIHGVSHLPATFTPA